MSKNTNTNTNGSANTGTIVAPEAPAQVLRQPVKVDTVANAIAKLEPLPAWAAEKDVDKILSVASSVIAATATGDGVKVSAAKARMKIATAQQGQNAYRKACERVKQAETFLESEGWSLIQF